MNREFNLSGKFAFFSLLLASGIVILVLGLVSLIRRPSFERTEANVNSGAKLLVLPDGRLDANGVRVVPKDGSMLLNLGIDSMEPIHAIELQLRFNPTILRLDDIGLHDPKRNGCLANATSPALVLTPTNNKNDCTFSREQILKANQTGLIKFGLVPYKWGEGTLGEIPPGSDMLVRLRFTGISEGDTQIKVVYQQDSQYDTNVVSRMGGQARDVLTEVSPSEVKVKVDPWMLIN